jgi:hypothetical protein
MKYILSMIIILAVALSATAQVSVRYGITAFDTSAASQTHYIYPGTNTIAGTVKFKEAGDLEVLFVADSLSGATAGTATLQYAYSDAAAPHWYDAATYTINGVQTLGRTQALSFTALKWRIRVVNTSATQSNKCYAYYTWKRRV